MEAPSRNGNGWVRNIAWGVVGLLSILALAGGAYYVQSVENTHAMLRQDVTKVVETQAHINAVASGIIAEHRLLVDAVVRIETKLDALILSQAGLSVPTRRWAPPHH